MPIYFTLHAIVVGLDYHQRLERLQCAWNGSPVVPDQNNACGIVLHLLGLSPPPRPPCPRPPHYLILLFFLFTSSSFPRSLFLLAFSCPSPSTAFSLQEMMNCVDYALTPPNMMQEWCRPPLNTIVYTHTCTIST